MKRSEALKKLKHYMSYQNPYDDRDIEDQILDYCERIIGMLPPPKDDYYGAFKKAREGHGYALVSINRFQWEPEDEEE